MDCEKFGRRDIILVGWDDGWNYSLWVNSLRIGRE